MRILITTGIFAPEAGGPAMYTVHLAQELKKRGHVVSVVTYSDERRHQDDNTYSFPIFRIIRRNKISNYIRYFVTVCKNISSYDFVYSLDWFAAGFPVSVACRIFQKKYVLRVGGAYIWEKHLQDGGTPCTLREFYEKKKHKKYFVINFLITLVFKSASRIIFNSDIQKEIFERAYNIPTSKTNVIYNPIPVAKKQKTLQSKEIIFAGRLNAKNNVSLLIKAFHAVFRDEYVLVVIGDGPEKSSLVKLSNSLGLNTQFVPTLNQQDLWRRIQQAYLVVLPSWTDVSPNTAYECIALGTPFLITRENYLPIRDKISYMFDPYSVKDLSSKLLSLSNPYKYAHYKKSLEGILPGNSWYKVADDHVNIFKTL